MNENLKTVGKKIRELRKSAGLTQNQLASKSGVSTMTIRRYESGERTPTIFVLGSIAAALNVPTTELVPDNFCFPLVNSYIDGKEANAQLINAIGEAGARETALLKAFYKLGRKGQLVAIERIEELTQIPDYQRDDTPKEVNDRAQAKEQP